MAALAAGGLLAMLTNSLMPFAFERGGALAGAATAVGSASPSWAAAEGGRRCSSGSAPRRSRLILVAALLGATGLGVLLGRRQGHLSQSLREPFAVLQAALLGVVGLILAFGLALAVGRYESRRAAVVEEANAIGTTYLRAQLLAEPVRTSRSSGSCATPTRASVSRTRFPGVPRPAGPSPTASSCNASCGASPDRRVDGAPTATAPRLYVETLNEMIDMQTVRVAGLNNRVPPAVLWLEIAGAMVALGLLAFYLAILGRGLFTVLFAAGLVGLLLLGDLRPRPADARPHRRALDAADGAPRLDDPATGGFGNRQPLITPFG